MTSSNSLANKNQIITWLSKESNSQSNEANSRVPNLKQNTFLPSKNAILDIVIPTLANGIRKWNGKTTTQHAIAYLLNMPFALFKTYMVPNAKTEGGKKNHM